MGPEIDISDIWICLRGIGRKAGICALGLLALTACQDNDVETVDLSETVSETELVLAASADKRPGVYRFGFDLRSSPQEDARQLLPFLKYLTEETGLEFALSFTRRGQNLSDLVGQGHVHFAAAGAGTYLRTRNAYGAHIVARGLNSDGLATYRSVIAVASDSKILAIEDLRGKRVAFGNIDSTQGYIIPRLELQERGIDLSDFVSYQFAGSHLDCINTVIADQADACGLQETLAERLAQQGLVRIVFRSPEYPSSGIIASDVVPPEDVEAVRQALLAFQPSGRHQDGLYNWHLTEMPLGFIAARGEDYDRLDGAMQLLEASGDRGNQAERNDGK